ncbi:hypothetical protein VOLCADRAFT_116305 [Volvox carteri f. nagariensis]|uniref:Protein kinase domain-containing protein n=1 Tax=Volvox carteri f. nagariensis TaxID=3068 RepID=D8TL14_VOLCA|nr:uncharacterized protein VOLCADRAFT_116305 [Volvox carteri f. nagariensis]EFJ51656.1 hypothetical protein VOLCADRAFT_116305 [Volvox carteri f. nagariensis]|eukprot:XP_002947066.1 hypothetical protein VOLCADRAFT_116305 [Volvox carteri f. nagariensis]
MVVLPLLLFFFLVDHPCVLGRAVGPITSVNEMLNALRDESVDQVFLGPGVLSLDALSASAGGGLSIGPNRRVEFVGSVSIQQLSNSTDLKWPSAQGFQFASGIDFGSNAQGIFKLFDNTTLGFRSLFLWRSLSQLGYDAQVLTLAQPGIRAGVRFIQTVKLRDGCLPLQIFVQHVTSYTRLATKGGQQTASLQPFCYVAPPGSPAGWDSANGSSSRSSSNTSNVTCAPEVLAIDDLATSITRPNGQSYDLYEQKSTYWCRAYASMSCLSASGPEQCVKELLVVSSSGTALPSAESDGSKLTNILLPAILTGVLTLAFLSATVWCIHRRGAAQRGSSLRFQDLDPDAEAAAGGGGGGPRGVGARVGGALARLLPGTAAWDVQRRKPNVQGYVPVVSKEALDRIAKVRAELSSKMVVSSSSDDLSDVRNLQLVGKGTFGRVYKGEWKGVTVALKVISVPVSQCGQAQWQQVLGEAAISTLLNHPCVLQTYSVALLEYSPALKPVSNPSEDGAANGASSGEAGTPSPPQQQQPVSVSGAAADDLVPFYQLKMVSEFCEGGSVVGALRRMQFYDSIGGGTVASGMTYLHSANIVHADLKAANVLLKQQPGSGRLQAKVGDFGLSFRLEEPEATHVTKGQLGSITHMAPEVLVHGRVSKASDVYSFGILLYELYTGQQAYWDVPQPMLAYHVATAGGRPLLPAHCPPAYRALAKVCWSSEPAARPTFQDVYRRLQLLAEEVHVSMSARRSVRSGGPRSEPPLGPDAAAAAAVPVAEPIIYGGVISADGQLLPGGCVLEAVVDIGTNKCGCVAPPPSQVTNAGGPAAAAPTTPTGHPSPQPCEGLAVTPHPPQPEPSPCLDM